LEAAADEFGDQHLVYHRPHGHLDRRRLDPFERA
jgi:hypothetical protein